MKKNLTNQIRVPIQDILILNPYKISGIFAESCHRKKLLRALEKKNLT